MMYNFIFIDDEDLIRELFAELMDYKEEGFNLVKVFESAEEATKYLKKDKNIQLVITDIKMGTMSGIDFCEYAKNKYPNIELVIMSGYKEFEYAQKAIKCNVFDYLLKPTSYNDLKKLFERLKQHLDSKKKVEQENKNKELTSSPNNHYINLVDTIIQYMEKRYAQDISLEDVATYVSMNSAYLSRFFKQQTGKNFLEYLSEIRVEKAKEMLCDPTMKVYEIGQLVGYKSAKHFYKIFKNYVGVTPTEYREQKNE